MQHQQQPPTKAPPKQLPTGFTRNSSIRLSDNRARRSVRKPADGTLEIFTFETTRMVIHRLTLLVVS